MQTTPRKLRPALAEVRLARQDQDQVLVEVPKRASLDREAEARKFRQMLPVSDNQ